MNRRERLFATKSGDGSASDLVPLHVNFTFNRDDRRRKRGELRQLAPEEKMLCALRKVLADLSHKSGGQTRYFLVGTACRILDRHVSPGAKEGEPGTYRFRGRCELGVAHASGDTARSTAEFTVSFRDTEDSMGLPDVAYFEPTTVDQLDARTPL